MQLRKMLVVLLILSLCLALPACSATTASSSATGTTAAAAGTTGAATTAKPAEKVTLKYFCALKCPDVYTSHDQMLCFQLAEKATGINIDWIHPPKGQETEQFNLLVASANKPDIMEGNWRTFSGGPDTAISTNIIQDISKAVEQYMPNFKAYVSAYPEIVRQITSDSGKYYCVPYIFTNSKSGSTKWSSILDREPVNETYVGIIMRKDWLEELKLDTPVTIDDYIKVLTAFKEKKGVQSPFSTTLSFLKQSLTFASAYDTVSTLGFIDINKKAVFSPIQDSFKEYLNLLNKLYKAGLLDKDFAVQDNTTNLAKVTSGQTGMWLGYYSSWCNNLYDQLHSQDPKSTFVPVGLANPVKEKGQQLIYKQSDYPYRDQGAAITTSCKNVQAALTFLDWSFTKEGDLAMNWGVENDTFVWKDGWPSLTEKVTKDADKLGTATAIQKYINKNGPVCMDYYNRLVLGKSSGTEEGLLGLARWNAKENGTQSASFPLVTATKDEGIRLTALKTEINTYVSECYVKFIMGEMPISEFDNYVKTVKSMGLDEYTKLTQASLDRYYSR